MEDYYEDTLVARSDDYGFIMRGLEKVIAFVEEHGRILVGGMAIDLALKGAGGEGIYKANKMPDYDFLSPDSVADSAALGVALCQEGFPDVSVINGIHTTTRRVRIGKVAIADITYCPQEVFDSLPTIGHEKLRLIHPHYQMMDMHRALSYPFEDPNRPVIFNRWKKDCVRYDALAKYYAIEGDATEALNGERKDITKLPPNVCLAGWAALSYLEQTTEGSKGAESEYVVDSGAPIGHVLVPKGQPIQLYSDSFIEIAKSLAKGAGSGATIKYVESPMGKLRRSILITAADGAELFEIFDNNGEKVTARRHGGGPWVTNLQNVMLFLLVRRYMGKYRADPDYIRATDNAYVRCAAMVANGMFPDPSNVYGKSLWGQAFIVARRRYVARLTKSKAPSGVPKNGYPEKPKCEASSEFDYGTSPYFAVSGLPTKTPFEPEDPGPSIMANAS